MKSWGLMFCGAVLLGGCTSSPPPVRVDPEWASSSQRSAAMYIVQKGDTLWSISKKFGVSVDELRRANPGVETLEVGQALALPGRAAAPDQRVVDDGPVPRPESSYIRPVRGHAILKRGEDRAMIVVSSRGEDVVAVKSGKVSFVGPVQGYGQVVMLRHGDDTVTFYGNTSDALVAQGQNVRQGQTLARVAGGSGQLVFKLFRGDAFVDPAQYIR